MRLYNGCPDKELKAKWETENKARQELAKYNAHCTYFPIEQQYLVFSSDHAPIGEFKNTIVEACFAAISILKKN